MSVIKPSVADTTKFRMVCYAAVANQHTAWWSMLGLLSRSALSSASFLGWQWEVGACQAQVKVPCRCAWWTLITPPCLLLPSPPNPHLVHFLHFNDKNNRSPIIIIFLTLDNLKSTLKYTNSLNKATFKVEIFISLL